MVGQRGVGEQLRKVTGVTDLRTKIRPARVVPVLRFQARADFSQGILKVSPEGQDRLIDVDLRHGAGQFPPDLRIEWVVLQRLEDFLDHCAKARALWDPDDVQLIAPR